MRQLQSLPRPGRPLRVLDLGCGDGTLGALAAARVPSAVIGLDWAEGSLRRSRARGLTVLRSSLDAGLPFAAGCFDVVIMSEVIEHLVDPDLALAEVLRILTVGGTLLLSTPNLAAWFNRLLLAAGVQPLFSEVSKLGIFGRPGTQVVGHLRLFTARALREVLAAHGFVDVHLAGASYHDTPVGARWLDRLLALRPGLAAITVAAARKPGPAGSQGGPGPAPN